VDVCNQLCKLGAFGKLSSIKLVKESYKLLPVRTRMGRVKIQEHMRNNIRLPVFKDALIELGSDTE